jgi:hypothetical protein
MIRALVTVTWTAGAPPDPQSVTLQTGFWSRALATLFGHDNWTWRRTVHTRTPQLVIYQDTYAPIIRHELRHVWQQAQIGSWHFLWRYVFGHQTDYEADARLYEQPTQQRNAVYPRWT